MRVLCVEFGICGPNKDDDVPHG
eukprot:SAG31_NODE_17113_length_683_cov_0.910959_1_plen_22_part_10